MPVKPHPSAFIRGIYVCVAAVSLLLAILGVFLPLLPTTPFVLVAAWSASKGSPRLHQWLYRHHRLGPLLNAWDTHGAVPHRAKWLACIAMTASWTMMLIMGFGWLLLGVMAALFIAVAAFLITRPDS